MVFAYDKSHDDVMTWKHFPYYWSFMVECPHKGPVMWRFDVFSVVCMNKLLKKKTGLGTQTFLFNKNTQWSTKEILESSFSTRNMTKIYKSFRILLFSLWIRYVGRLPLRLRNGRLHDDNPGVIQEKESRTCSWLIIQFKVMSNIHSMSIRSENIFGFSFFKH